MGKAKSGGKSGGAKKRGRATRNGQNLRYINERRHEKSHIRRIQGHLKRFPDDKAAQTALLAWQMK